MTSPGGAPQVHTAAVIGLGLIGGSLALAMRAAGFAARIEGADRDPAACAGALARGVVDAIEHDPMALVDRADLVILAVPPLTAAALLPALLARALARPQPPVVTDVASVKGHLLAAVEEALGAVPACFVPGHPIAGSERSGVAAADGGLFRAHRVLLTPAADCDPAALALVEALWRSAGAEVERLTVTEHDSLLAHTSHLPHVLAYCLVDTLAGSAERASLFRYAAGGFRDFTRIASSDPLMWRDVALVNRSALLAALDGFTAQRGALRGAIADGDGDRLLATFAAAKAARDEFAAALAARQSA